MTKPTTDPKDKLDYITTADGWTAGKWRAKGDPVQLTAAQAKYENVILDEEASKPKGAAKK